MINKNRRLWQTWTLTEERSCGGCRLVRSGGGLEGGGLRSVCGEGGGGRGVGVQLATMKQKLSEFTLVFMPSEPGS